MQRSTDKTRRLPRRERPPTSWRNKLSVPLAVAGGALFLGSYLGVVALPFDQHHVVTQIVGLGVAIIGLGWIGTRR